jgi:low affinity Fe/Cu permease
VATGYQYRDHHRDVPYGVPDSAQPNQDTLSIQIKLSELVLAVQGAENKLAHVEDLPTGKWRRLQAEYRRRADSLEDSLADKRKSRTKTKPQ